MDKVPACLEEHADDYTVCSGPRSKWEPTDPLLDAVEKMSDKRIQTVNVNDYICGQEQCHGVVGGVVVYSDFSHLTTTYVKTLRPYLERSLMKAIEAAD
jgi:hypothetical protein